MISLPQNILNNANAHHLKHIKPILLTKKEVLRLCLDYYCKFSRADKQDFNLKLQNYIGIESIAIISVNWFLKTAQRSNKTTKKISRKISSINKTENFFNINNRLIPNKPVIINELKSFLDYLTDSKISLILSGKPQDIINESNSFKQNIFVNYNKTSQKHIIKLINFLFDYSVFSEKDSIYSQNWGSYKLTESLEVRTCLYCNRNYIQTVSYDKVKVVRPELDHFFPQSIHPILALSFYNLIPSCHTCNSNLKGKVPFSLTNYFHPYLSSFDNENVKFTYRPESPQSFFNTRNGLNIKLDTSKIHLNKVQIENNISLFKLDDIYNNHEDIVEGLLDLQRKTNKKKITDIFENILVDTNGNKYSMNEDELYELAIRNHFNTLDYHKKTMAKFEKDIAIEIGLL